MGERFIDNWTTQLRKGLLEFCILSALDKGRLYGYDIVRQLRTIECLVISEGTIYPLLSRLKREGFVTTTLEESSQGPARKYYHLSDAGRESLDQMGVLWGQVVSGVENIRTTKGIEQ